MVERVANLEPFEWISMNLWELGRRPDGGEGHTMRHLLPDHFEAYYKIMHPIYRDTSILDEEIQWSNESEFDERNLIRIKWLDLCQKYGVEYNKYLSSNSFQRVFRDGWPRYLLGAIQGELESDLRDALVEILVQFCSTNRWYYKFFLCSTKDFEEALYVGDRKYLAAIQSVAEAKSGPEYWWPEDQSWCVCSDYDSQFTIVAASKNAIAEIRACQQFEGFDFSALDRIDWKADEQNRLDS